MGQKEGYTDKRGIFMKFLDVVEKVGNKLPHPFMIFVYLAFGIIVFSWLISLFNVSVYHPGEEEQVAVRNMISVDGLEFMLSSMLTNFTGFAPLGLVLVMMFGIGLAQKVGLIETFMKRTILNAPKRLITFVIIGTGVIGNLASDAAFVIIPPLAAMVFYALGRHPLAGMAAGFAGVGAGFTANVIVAGTDALLSGISTEVARTIDSTANVTPVDNWFFMSASVIMLMIVGTVITERVVEPRLGTFDTKYADQDAVDQKVDEPTALEIKGLKVAGIAGFLYVALVALTIVPENGILRGEEGTIVPSLFLDNIIPIILFLFLTVAISYGVTTKMIQQSSDVPEYMGGAMKDMSGFIVLIFAASQFIAYFDWSNIGIFIAVSGADILQNMQFTGLGVIVGFILLTGVLNLFIFSGSAQWALMAPIFIPMFMILDYNPAFVQLAYRIADSSTNIITPMNPYVPMVLAFMKKYDNRAGFGTLFSIMLPYAMVFLTLWIVMFVIWTLLGIPIGPGVTPQ
ncbi:AbgT family transporter [Salisediminibacterium halotolerans]|uniref:AbgT family transporter n=1 Tax=Salisediminibacterium halotolerans TaxID=517425 RepID=UPI000F22C8CF|nr:AbgT family transporter [Salisediminibacterium halotolerans]RLJ75680.1 aminobenzoyl-glutamate transport protein [Actinophytocola xinjiangensis]RPE89534.1 aminobenzoyl-glutamate transport protein [Salisediminibacterium halotolerans]TWG36293.1 aminobenzoyl-glutamate transport protein [Salisediminibacterium halotolerans]GEL09057.1 p-aminobenzoyl-glutamate transporter [Salisediminibacterium halotolerans]